MSQQPRKNSPRHRYLYIIAAIFSLLSMGVWVAVVFLQTVHWLPVLLPISWHAHEMVFAFISLVVAGYFLPRSISHFKRSIWLPLALLLWCTPRVLAFVDHPQAITGMMVVDGVFILLLLAIVVVGKQQLSTVRKGVYGLSLTAYALSNMTYYLGLHGGVVDGERIGLYAGMYLGFLLLMLIAEDSVPLSRRQKDESDRHLCLPWWFQTIVISVLMMTVGWSELLLKPAFQLFLFAGVSCLFLLAGLYRLFLGKLSFMSNTAIVVAYLFIALGFAIKAGFADETLLPRLANHAVAIGGVGLLSLVVMLIPLQRHKTSQRGMFMTTEFLMFGAIAGAALIFNFLPLWLEPKYILIVTTAQLGWIVGFLLYLFLLLLTPNSLRKRHSDLA